MAANGGVTKAIAITKAIVIFTGPALIAVFFLKTEAAILHKYV